MFMNELRIWVTGAQGKLGKSLVNYLSEQGYVVLPSDKEVDVTDLDAIIHYAESHRPDVIINCAALTGIAVCEENQLEAYKVNALGARNVASAAQRIRAKIIQISTDDVFAGTEKMTLNEFDTPTPTTIYGKSKLAGETMVKELNPKHMIIRSSWIYDIEPGNFLHDLFENIIKGNTYAASTEQFSSPTSAIALCKLVEILMDSSEYGVFHASCEGECSRYEFAKKALTYAGLTSELLVEGNSEYGQQGHFILDNLMLKMTGIYTMPTWDKELKRFIEEYQKGGNA